MQKVQSEIVDQSFPGSKSCRMSLKYQGIEFRSERESKQAATNDLILQVFRHIEAKLPHRSRARSQNTRQTSEKQDFFERLAIPTKTPPINICNQYSLFERTNILLNSIKTFDNLLFE